MALGLYDVAQVAGNAFARSNAEDRRKQLFQQQSQAADLLNQSFMQAGSNPDAARQLYIQAYQLAPDFVSNAVTGLQSQQKALGAGEGMTPYQRETLDLRRRQVESQQAKINQDIETKRTEAAQKEEQKQAQIGETINLLDRMIQHPGRKTATGASSFASNIPGTDARGFKALFDTLKGQQFLNEVQALKGMGQLSNAEGDKLAAAAASLDLGMPEDDFLSELERIKSSLEKARSTPAGTYKTPAGATAQQDETVIDWESM